MSQSSKFPECKACGCEHPQMPKGDFCGPIDWAMYQAGLLRLILDAVDRLSR